MSDPGEGKELQSQLRFFLLTARCWKVKILMLLSSCTPDHWHAPMAIAAAKAGKHVYLEKPMTHSIEEAIELRNTIKSTGVVFQLGHENRQQMSFRIAKELIQKGVLGNVSMVQTIQTGMVWMVHG